MTSNIKILHVFNDQKKFSKDFFLFLEDHGFDLSRHYLFHYGKDDDFYKGLPIRYVFGGSFFSIWSGIKLLPLLFKSEKIVVHSLAAPFLLFYLWLFPFLNKKVYWVIWGKDLYFYRTLDEIKIYHKLYEFFRKRVIRNIKHIVTHVNGDYELARLWYNTEATWIECFIYPSNLFRVLNIQENPDNIITILAGNSADPTNEHEDMLKKLSPFSDQNLKIYCPLSYGDEKYAKKICNLGVQLFGEKFIPLMDFIPFNDYMNLLAKVDIAVFNHKRQQAFGTKVTLLGSGKKIYLSRESNLWNWFKNKNVKVFDIDDFNIDPISKTQSEKNIDIIKDYFSEENLVAGLKLWLE